MRDMTVTEGCFMLADLPSDGRSQSWPIGCNPSELHITQRITFEKPKKLETCATSLPLTP